MDTCAWSATRARTLQDCRRRYHYRYHLAPRARQPDPPPEAVEAARVKDLVGLEAWTGEVVHATLRAVLERWRAGRSVTEEEAAADAVRRLRRGFRDSGAWWREGPEAFAYRPTLLDLHVYGDGRLERERAAALRELACGAVRGFLRSELAECIRAAGPGAWLPIDRNAAARLEGGLLVLVKPDFAFRDGRRIRVLDWKTGRPDPFWESIQLLAYALYAAEKWHCDLQQVLPAAVHLYPEFHVREAPPDADSLRDVTTFIRETHAEMRELDGAASRAAEEWPAAEDPRACRWCAFRGPCSAAAGAGGAALPQQGGSRPAPGETSVTVHVT